MQRLNNLHSRICTAFNIEEADDKARKHKKHRYGIIKHDNNREEENKRLLYELQNLIFKTSEYTTYKIYEPKERIIFRLPYYPDRIVHHAIMNIMEPIWVKTMINNTYSCIKERGILKLANDLKKVLREDKEGTTYCLKLDIKKFYPSINHDVLKDILRKKIKDKELLAVLDEIVDSTDGVPIGNYLSQFFANLVLTYYDHWIKEDIKVKYYFRYADDIIFLSDNKDFLEKILIITKLYLHNILDLKLKNTYQIFKVEERGIDFVGYRFYHTHTLLRKNIKKRMFRVINKYIKGEYTIEILVQKMQSYFGWLKHCDSKYLLQKIEKLTGLHYSNWKGIESKISNFYDKNVRIIEIVKYSKYFKIHFIYNNNPYSVNSTNKKLYKYLKDTKFPTNYKFKNHAKSKKTNIYRTTKNYR